MIKYYKGYINKLINGGLFMKEVLVKKICGKVAEIAENQSKSNEVVYSPFFLGYEIKLNDKNK